MITYISLNCDDLSVAEEEKGIRGKIIVLNMFATI